MSFTPKRRRANKPTCTNPVADWPSEVLDLFKSRLEQNINRNSQPYFHKVSLGEGAPPTLAQEECWNPAGSSTMMVCHGDYQYQRPLHRLTLLLKLRDDGHSLKGINEEDQASHLCPDAINDDKRGDKHCCNPHHMVLEDDKTNKSRQRCPGWLWIEPRDGNPGDFWYNACKHQPKCKVYTK